MNKEFKSVMLAGGWGGEELLVSSSTFSVIQCLHRSTHTGRIQTLSLSTVFIVTPETGYEEMHEESTVTVRSSRSRCSTIPSSLVNAQLQLLPWLELGIQTH